jgi:hypothetical protein
LYEDEIRSEVICGIDGCTCDIFAIDLETAVDLRLVGLMCYRCKYARQVSKEKYDSMINIDNFLLKEWMDYGYGWNDLVFEKKYGQMMDRKIMKIPQEKIRCNQGRLFLEKRK